MADLIPFVQSDNNYVLGVPFGDVRYMMTVRWNSRDAAWYMDIRLEDDTPVALGLKLVLGPPLGRRSTDPFFQTNILQVVDTTGTGVDAAFDDLGGRIQVMHLTLDDLESP